MFKSSTNGAVAGQERETRERLLESARLLFAERGFNNVSVREICNQAGTNVAAVNYHFRDKMGLYKAVIADVAEAMGRAKLEAMDAGEGFTPEEQLRTYIRIFLHHLLGAGEDCWMDKLIAREMIEPTPALDLIIEKGIKPSSERLMNLVGQLLGLPAHDLRVIFCGLSVQAQCVWYRSSRTVCERMAPDFKFTPEIIQMLAQQIADFSLAGMRTVALEKKGPRRA